MPEYGRGGRHSLTVLLSATSVMVMTMAANAPQALAQSAIPQSAAQRCEGLTQSSQAWPDPTMRILSAIPRPAGAAADLGFGGMKSPPLPAHCEILGIMHERTGIDGSHYAIRFHLRLPDDWNGRFLFEGGGGTDGNLGFALGMINFRGAPLLVQGYAVASDDSGHSNELNADPAAGGLSSFGRDPQARADYGHAALKATYDAAQAVMARFYAKIPVHSYFAGCSKGGQEGLAFAEHYPKAFDGILAGSPGMSLPRAALGHPWSAQAFGAIVGGGPNKQIPVAKLSESFSDADFGFVRQAVLDACDADDGLKDGIVGSFAQCTTKKVDRELRKVSCKGNKSASCLGAAQIAALEKFMRGPTNSKGQALYVSYPWDAGVGSSDWRGWTIGAPAKVGMPPGFPGAGGPPVSVTMGAGSLSEIFSTPPKVIPPGAQPAFDYLLSYDFDRDARAIYATSAEFPRSAWDDINARSPDLDALRGNGGKLIVYQGVSDGVFSINDTIAWWNEVNGRMGGDAADAVRVFAVPGMGHCMGGPATDQFDGFGALVDWVEHGKAPNQLQATAGPGTPWPGRERPLCPYPSVARYAGKGDIEKAESFMCVVPQGPR